MQGLNASTVIPLKLNSDYMKIGEIIKKLEEWAPPSYQESYDNSGLIVGNQQTEVSGVLICLDSVEETIDEALEKGCNLVIAHHPILFRGIKSLTGRNYVERTLIKAIQNNVAIYAIHTNLDNIDEGVNQKIGELMGIENSNILVPKTGILQKLATYCPLDKADTIKNALFQAGAGKLGNYDSCSFNTNGEGSYRPLDGSNPYAGQSGELHREAETKVEVVFPKPNQSAVVNALLQSHPYEEVAYEIYETLNEHRYVGSGQIWRIERSHAPRGFSKDVKRTIQAQHNQAYWRIE